MRLSSQIQAVFMIQLMTAGIQGTVYSPSTAFRIAKQGSPEFYGLGCSNHKQSNKIRQKRKIREMKKRKA